MSGDSRQQQRQDDGKLKTSLKASVAGIIAVVAYGALLFSSAGTFAYWQAWAFLAVFAVASVALGVYGSMTNPAVLRRRLRAGPAAESRTAQKIASSAIVACYAAMLVFSAVDHRLGWSTVPAPVSFAGDVLVAAGLAMATLVLAQNNYAAANITLEAEQPVVSTGLYGLVRHPMYLATLITMLGVPLALGSMWALLVLIPALIAFAVRIFDEEQFLSTELVGYRAYMHKVRHRLIPKLW